MERTKSFILSFLLGAVVFSCSDEFGRFDEANLYSSERSLPHRRTFEEALQIAKDALSMLDGEPATRSSRGRQISIDDTHLVRKGANSRSAEELDTLMYVFNFEDSLGFAIVSANRATPGLIAITEKGNYNPTKGHRNKAFEMIMNRTFEYIASTMGHGTITEPDSFITWGIFVQNLVPVIWGQESVYGMYFNNGLAGCGPVAIAQAMTYFRKPDTLLLTYENRLSDTLFLDWTEIIKHHEQHLGIDSTRCTAINQLKIHKDIGFLLRQIGELTGFDDTKDSITTTRTSMFPAFLNSVGIANHGIQTFIVNGFTQYAIDNHHILLIFASNPLREHDGHAFIVDGYLPKYRYTRTESGLYLKETIIYNHVNWGWDGNSNGLYLENIFDVNQPFALDGHGQNPDTLAIYTDSLGFIDMY